MRLLLSLAAVAASSVLPACGSSSEVALPSTDAGALPDASYRADGATADAPATPDGDGAPQAPTWSVEVDTAHPGRALPTTLLGHYDLAGSLWHYDQKPDLIRGMGTVDFTEWRSSVERWEGRSEMFPTTSSGATCTYPVPTFVPSGWTDLDLLKSRDWFVDDGMPVTIADTMNDARYSLAYARSVIDVAAAYGAESFLSIDAMPKALSLQQTPYRDNCYWSFWNGVTNEPPADPNVFAAAAVGLVQRLVLGSGGEPGRKVRYFEFWNEPEGNFWDSTHDPDHAIFYTTAQATLTALAQWRATSNHPELRFGFSGFASTGASIASIQKFDAMSPPVPLDFLSFHSYNTDPIGVAHDVENVLAAVKATKNYANIETALTEWGPGQDIEHNDDSRLNPNEAYAHSIDPALHAATALARAATAGLDHAHHVFFWDFWPFRIRGLFQNDLQTRPQYWAFRMLTTMIGSGNHILPVTSGASDSLIVLATQDGGGHVRVLLVNRTATSQVARVNLGGTAGTPSAVQLYDDPNGVIQPGTSAGDTVTVPGQAIVLVDF
jgi:hypothetical protein